MKTLVTTLQLKVGFLVLCLVALLTGSASAAGIPEPPLLIIGKVVDDNNNLVTSGVADITLRTADQSRSLTIMTELQELIVPGGTEIYSYSVQFPLETVPAGRTVSPGVFPVPTASQDYEVIITPTVSTVGYTPTVVDVTLAPDDHRSAVRLMPDAGPDGAGSGGPTCNPGDANYDEFVSLPDFSAVAQNFGTNYQGASGTPLGDGNCDLFVSLPDFSSVAQNFGQNYGTNTAGIKRLDLDRTDDRQSTPRIYATTAAPFVQSGETFNVEIRLDGSGQPIRIVGIFLDFDETLMSFNSGTVNTTVFNNGLLTGTPAENETGIISFSAGSNADVSQNGVLVATLSFTANATGTAAFDFLTTAPRVTGVQNETAQEIASIAEDTTIEIVSDIPSVVRLAPGNQTIDQSQQLTVTVRLDGNGNPGRTVGVFVQFDPSLLAFDTGSVNTAVFNNALVTGTPSENETGIISFSAGANADLSANDILVATLRFDPIGTGNGNLTLLTTAPRETGVLDTDSVALPTSVQGSSYTINEGGAGSRTVSIPTNIFVAAGQQVQVPINIDDASGVLGYRLGVDLSDPNVSYGGAYAAGTLTQACFTPEINTSNPDLFLVSNACDTALSGSGSLGLLTLSVSPTATAGTTIPLPFDVLTRLNDGDIAVTTVAGSLTILPEGTFRWGDIDCPLDDIVGTNDASAALRFDVFLQDVFPCAIPQATTRPGFPPAGDVNGDGELGTLDASLILQFDATLIDYFPVDLNQDGFGPEITSKTLTLFAYGRELRNEPAVIDVADMSATPGEVFPIRIDTDGFNDVLGWRLAFAYDDAALEFVGVDTAGSLSNGFLTAENDKNGIVYVGAASAVPVKTAAGSAASLLFRVKPGTLAGNTTVNLIEAESQINDGAIPLAVTDGASEITINATRVMDWSLID